MSSTSLRSGRPRHRRAKSTSRAAALRNSSVAGNNVDDAFITPSSGNVFEDVGFPPEEARSLLLRGDLMMQIEQVIKKRRLTQARAAKLFRVSQPRISDLMRGKLEQFSIDTLITMLGRAGLKVEISVTPRAA
jgi:predicted XRE-type DNA-binding protein